MYFVDCCNFFINHIDLVTKSLPTVFAITPAFLLYESYSFVIHCNIKWP